MGWSGGGSAPEPDPLIGQAAMANAAISKESLDWYKATYASDIKPAQDADLALRKQVTSAQLESMAQQDAFAREQRDYYNSTIKPVQTQAASDALNYDSDENVNKRMGIATAGATQAFSSARGQSARMLARYGINPNSSAFALANAQLTNQEALGVAGAGTGAAFDTMDRAIALRSQFARDGNAIPSMALGYYQGGNAAGTSASGVSAQGYGLLQTGSNGMLGAFNNSVQQNQSAATISNMDFSGRMQGYAADQQAKGAMYQGIGSAIGAIGGVGLAKSGWLGVAGAAPKTG